jgi:hypothetical protein
MCVVPRIEILSIIQIGLNFQSIKTSIKFS